MVRKKSVRIILTAAAGLTGLYLLTGYAAGLKSGGVPGPAGRTDTFAYGNSQGGPAENGGIPSAGETLRDKELDKKLSLMAADDAEIAEIYRNSCLYPDELLRALVLNPEMKEFVRGYPDSEGKVTRGFTRDELESDAPLFLQWDPRWGYYPYGDSCMGLSGCGPTCLSMVIFALTRNEDATPDALAEYSMENGHYVAGTGTSWSLMTEAPPAYGVSAKELGLDENVMKRHLDSGGMIICAMRPGDFTTTGHFIVVCGYDGEGFLVNDPNSRERSDVSWPFSKLSRQIKNLWGLL